MNAKPINLRQQRKKFKRQSARDQADENAVRFGQTKSERALRRDLEKLARARHDGHRLDDDDG